MLSGAAGGEPAPAPASGPPAAREVRAVWYNFYRLPPRRADAEPLVASHVKSLSEMGINRVYVLVKTPDGFVFYDSKTRPKWSLPVADPRRPGKPRRVELDWDPLAYLLALGASYGIEVHPYVNVFCEGGEDAEDRRSNPLLGPHPEWAVVNRKGERTGWASPVFPEVVEYELGFLKEIASRYDVPGIQLDRIRLPYDTEAGESMKTVRGKRVLDAAPVDYNPETLRRFRRRHNRAGAAIPDDKDPDWVRFRQDLVTEFVRAARRELKAIRPQAALSAAVFPDPAGAAREQFQDWALWVREGTVDAVCTMAYEPRSEVWEQIVAGEAKAVEGRVPLIAGIGAMRFKTPGQLTDRIALARRRPVQGYVVFNAYTLLEQHGFSAALAEANR